MPAAIAASWSSATARIAKPIRLPWKNHVTAAITTMATPAARSLAVGIAMPHTSSGSPAMGSEMLPGTPRNASVLPPRMTMPSPSVTMISAIRGFPTSRRRTMRFHTTAKLTIPAHAPPAAARQLVQSHRRQPGSQHHPLSDGEVDDARRLVDDHKGQRHEGIDGAREGAVDEQGEKEPHRPQSAG